MAATLQHSQITFEDSSATHFRITKDLGHGGAVLDGIQAIISLER